MYEKLPRENFYFNVLILFVILLFCSNIEIGINYF